MNNGVGTFLLGLIAAVVLFMLWKKESRSSSLTPGATDQNTNNNAGCGGNCGAGCSGGCSAASPVIQGLMALSGMEGQISPGTPPLNSVAGGQGSTSFYSLNGVTPDSSFTFAPTARNLSSVGSPLQPPQGNVRGSATTPANVTPIRATQQVPGFSETGFQQRHNVVGVPLTAGARLITPGSQVIQ